MSTPPSTEGPWLAGHRASSSGLGSTTSTLSQVAAQPPSPGSSSEAKVRTSEDILDASRQLGQISLQGNRETTPCRQPDRHPLDAQSIVDDQDHGASAGRDEERDEDAKRNRNAREVAEATPMRSSRRPAFLRIDTRQHRRVASMLATQRSTSLGSCGDANAPRRPPLSLGLPLSTTADGGKNPDFLESYELRGRPRAEPVGLGIWFPNDHPLRNRAFSMHSTVPILDTDSEQRSERAPPTSSLRGSKKLPVTQAPCVGPAVQEILGVHSRSPARAPLRPTFLEVSPSPMEYLPPQASGAATYRDHAYDRSARDSERHGARTRQGRIDFMSVRACVRRAFGERE